MKYNLILAISLLFAANLLVGQNMLSPVDWSFDTEKVSDTEYNIIFTAEIENGWFVYSQFLEGDGPIPTSFTFDEANKIELVGEASENGDHKKEGYDEIFMMNLIKFGKKVKFTQRVKVEDTSASITGYLTFMTCNDESCLPPKDVDFEIKLN